MLGANQYGKSEIRVVKVAGHALRDLTVDVTLRGDFDAVHTRGDNTGLPATDTMRNVVYALAAEHPLDSVPDFAATIVGHWLADDVVDEASVRVREHPWQALGRPDAWQRGSGGTRVHVVRGDGQGLTHAGGLDDLLVLRSSGSAFSGFARDRYTTLPETDDRILATVVTARWDHEAEPAEEAWAAIRDDLLDAFTDHDSASVQQTLHRMGTVVLERHPDLERIALSLPNRHHLPFDVSRFGLENRNEIFHATTEPYGLIEATIERG